MAVKAFEVEGIGTVRVFKRRGARSLRLSIAADGTIRLTIPYWTSYADGLLFTRERSDWIASHIPARQIHLQHGDRIGKAHRLQLVHAEGSEPSSRIAGSTIRISRPATLAESDPALQKLIEQACIRGLRLQASKLLPGRLAGLAKRYNFEYTSITIKKLKGRWGSCDRDGRIVLNLFLMQLPWHLIDYVLLHELIHTKYLHHGPEFWQEFLRHNPRAKELQREIKQHSPVLSAVDSADGMA